MQIVSKNPVRDDIMNGMWGMRCGVWGMGYGVWVIESTKEKFFAKTIRSKSLVDLREECFYSVGVLSL